MTDRHAGYLVTIERDIREDDAQGILDAISMIRGVLVAEPVTGGIQQQIADNRARNGLVQKILKAAQESQ